ncbi:hypothetical protein EcWSU1_03696 [Enterobacter ludwigii]|uniref:Uncharacterized protein n=1 Tax=Enterobacter ludwigii TaxID=299767 RepID=G8LDB8_9ENTR|nr:hypothetical protein EcWSU1_03696 [Enterobacter ludwigii]
MQCQQALLPLGIIKALSNSGYRYGLYTIFSSPARRLCASAADAYYS